MIKTRAWGNNGADRDDIGLLPVKEVHSIQGYKTTGKAPIGVIKQAIAEFIDQHHYSPNKVFYGGKRLSSSYVRVKVRGQSVGVDLVYCDHMRDGYFEAGVEGWAKTIQGKSRKQLKT